MPNLHPDKQEALSWSSKNALGVKLDLRGGMAKGGLCSLERGMRARYRGLVAGLDLPWCLSFRASSPEGPPEITVFFCV